MPTAAINPLKLKIIADTTSGYVHRSIEVQADSQGDFYAVHVVDIVNSTAHNHGLLTGEPGEKTAQSRLNQEVIGAYTTLEEANAKAMAQCEMFLNQGAWKKVV